MHSNRTQIGESFIALVGTPNSGKTTLYNWLTGSKFKTVNYPGATVEYSLGTLSPRWGSEKSFLVMDTPGTYSLEGKSADELVTHDAIFKHPERGSAQIVIVVIDGTQMERHLALAQQIQAAGFRMIIAVTMSDELLKAGLKLNPEALEKYFNAPVVQTEGVHGGGIKRLVNEIEKLMELPRQIPVVAPKWTA